MEIRVIARGGLAGLVAGVLAFVFARIFAEPVIQSAIDYEGARDDILDKINVALGGTAEIPGDDPVSRAVQRSWGIATGIVGLSIAMGLLLAVAYLVMHGRTRLKPRQLVWMLGGFGFLGVYVLPFVKYPANPPSIGHEFTMAERTETYLTMVAVSVVLLGLAWFLQYRLAPRIGTLGSVVVAVLAFLVAYGIALGVLPDLGELKGNVDAANDWGMARSATETPAPIYNIADHALTIDGMTYAPGQIMFQGFSADKLWHFRLYSLITQLIIWTVSAVGFGWLLDRYFNRLRSSGAPRQEMVTA